MSIYAVKLKEWFPPGDESHKIMRIIVETSRCYGCGKKRLSWQTAYGYHSLPWGNGNIWCTQKCFNRRKAK